MELQKVLGLSCLVKKAPEGYSSKVYHPGGDGILKKF